MTRTVQFIATGMVTFTPGSVPYPQTRPHLTFVMVENASKRSSHNDSSKTIVKHVPFVLAHRDNIATGSSAVRPMDLAPNEFGYGGWLLDKERLSLDKDPAQGITFDASLREIADLRALYPVGLMDLRYADIDPPSLHPVGAQMFVRSGIVKAGGKLSTAEFKARNDTSGPVIHIRNEVLVEFRTEDRALTLNAHALRSGAELTPLRFLFKEDQDFMQIYFGSAPPASLLKIPSGTGNPRHLQDVDFELYYDLTQDGPPDRRPIPHGKNGGPVPGSERCPPLQNRG